MTERQFSFLKALLDQYGLPYLWGGKGFATEPYAGRDCSGFVTSALFQCGGPDVRDTYNAQRMWASWFVVATPRFGAVALFGTPTAADHVMACLDTGGVLLGAHGGDHTVLSVDAAKAKGACVGLKPSSQYRDDLLGYRLVPWVNDTL